MLVPRYGVKNQTLWIPLSELVSTERLTNSKNIRLLLCGLEATDTRWRQKKKKKILKHNVTCQELEKYLDGFHFSQPEHRKIIIIIIISAAKPNLCWSEDHETSEMFFFFLNIFRPFQSNTQGREGTPRHRCSTLSGFRQAPPGLVASKQDFCWGRTWKWRKWLQMDGKIHRLTNEWRREAPRASLKGSCKRSAPLIVDWGGGRLAKASGCRHLFALSLIRGVFIFLRLSHKMASSITSVRQLKYTPGTGTGGRSHFTKIPQVVRKWNGTAPQVYTDLNFTVPHEHTRLQLSVLLTTSATCIHTHGNPHINTEEGGGGGKQQSTQKNHLRKSK